MKSALLFSLLIVLSWSHVAHAYTSWPWEGCGTPMTNGDRRGPLVFVVKPKIPTGEKYRFELIDVDPSLGILIPNAVAIIPQLVLAQNRVLCLGGQLFNVNGRFQYLPKKILDKPPY